MAELPLKKVSELLGTQDLPGASRSCPGCLKPELVNE